VAAAGWVSLGVADGSHARGWLGIAMGTADVSGVRVEHVVRGSPAETAGLRADDRVTQVDGVPVTNSRGVIRAIGGHTAGEAVTLTVARAGKPQQVRVVLAEFPPGDVILRMDRVGRPAPEWEGLTPAAGFPATISGLQGRVAIVDFWATWCGPCREVAPVLSDWQARYGSMGLTVVGITTDTPEAAAGFKERLELRYPMASDTQGTTTMAYGVTALPTLFVLDKRGVVRDVVVGIDAGEEARIETLVKTLLAEAPAPPAPR